MYQSVRALRGATVLTRDGAVGFEEQVFFDDERWVIRYLVVDAETPTLERSVLISPFSVAGIDHERGTIRVDLTTDQVTQSPDVDTDRPVSRQKEIEYSRYFHYPFYWGEAGLWQRYALPGALLQAADADAGVTDGRAEDDVHLRSSREVIGYRVRARDGRIGHVEDFIFDDASWAILCVELDTRNLLRGKRVLVSPRHFREVKWGEKRVHVDLSVAAIRDAPAYEGLGALTADFVAALDHHYAGF